MKRRFTLVIFLAVLIGGMAWLALTNRRLNAEVAAARRERATISAAPVAVAQPKPRLETPVLAPVAMTENSAATVPVIPSAKAEFWTDPAWRAARFNDAMLQAESRYGRFFLRLNWPADRLEALKRQFATNDVALLQAALSGAAGPRTDAEATAKREELDRLMAENQKALRNALGDSDYEKFDLVQRAEQYRESVGQIANTMRSRGIEVNSDLEEAILNGYAEAVRSVAAQPAPGTSAAALTDAQKADVRRQQAQAMQMELMRKLSGVLNEKQIDGFLQSYLEQQGNA